VLQAALIALALVLIGWCIWVRHLSWRCRRWDRALTIGMVLLAAALMLCAPVPGHYVWRILYPVTGIAHLRDYLGHLCFIAVVLCVIYSAACRLAPDDRVESLMRRADVPAAVAAQIMLIAVTMSGNLRQQRLNCPDFYDVPYDGWLRLYWATYGAVLAYLLVYLVRLLWVLRRDPRSQRGADLLLTAAAAGIPGAVTLVANALAAPSPHHLSLWAWFLACAPASLAAYACGASWRSRLRTFRDKDGDGWGRTPQPPQPAF
jgi:hypothetical protein